MTDNFVHGKDTYISVNGTKLEGVNASEITKGADVHDVTTYGKTAHVYKGGLKDGKGSLSGIYENSASGPRAVLEPLRSQTARIVDRPEGTGSGKPQDTFDAVIGQYVETRPVADMISWSCDLQVSDTVTGATQ